MGTLLLVQATLHTEELLSLQSLLFTERNLPRYKADRVSFPPGSLEL